MTERSTISIGALARKAAEETQRAKEAYLKMVFDEEGIDPKKVHSYVQHAEDQSGYLEEFWKENQFLLGFDVRRLNNGVNVVWHNTRYRDQSRIFKEEEQ